MRPLPYAKITSPSTESQTPWLYEVDYHIETIGAFHIIATRHSDRQFWNGYVGIPDRWVPDLYPFVKLADREIKFAGPLSRKGGKPGFTYYGFSCDRTDDLAPRDYNARNLAREDHRAWIAQRTYRTLDYVKAQCRDLVDELRRRRSWYRRLGRALLSLARS